ncbi:atrazine chlorohydrolase [Plesiocystis pacifica SIR-1]|uniref:Atrazine chlorohydrolase n=1 Tax=Plesiocystis pacifica SIR-1 TaxID=391625 RepID=A6G5Q3_9BACT|nr:formimidoylglutamate deiminase [Plesiocystis pacifica]EDM78834.1 atrazine chlorohydrolase [Plesiocystis pacifica SIR-1]
MTSTAGPEQFTLTARVAWVEPEGSGGVAALARDPMITVDKSTGSIVAIDDAREPEPGELVYDLGHSLLVPGMVNAHSHAFQRGIRGATHRRQRADPSSFWSWREAMYAAANALDPEGVYAITRDCFAEMLARGITCVGEFHYLHHQADGQPYADANELSKQVIRAADEVGLRLCLLEVYYARAGVGHDGPLPEQRRFCDGSVDRYLARVDGLRELAQSRREHRAQTLSVGVTPHSVRAVRAPELAELAAYAHAHELVLHSHVSEQPLENTQCREEHGRSPLRVFADAGFMTRPGAFTAVHAIHIDEPDFALMADQNICVCPTTEADLGDGIVPATRWREAGATLALGSDSNAIIDLVTEARSLELHERLRRQARLCLRDERGHVAPVLAAAVTTGGAAALGRPELGRLAVGSPFDAACFDLDHWLLRGVDPDLAVDALLLAGRAEAITQVWVGGRRRR